MKHAPSLFAATFAFSTLVALSLGASACGDDESASSGTGGASSASTTSSTTGSGSEGGGSGTDATTSTTTSGVNESCEATFRVLQKDAYKESAGRTSDLWPPHTTTVLEVACDGVIVDEAFEANHGTEPGAVDAAGDVILVETASFSTPGTRAELVALREAYGACDCEATTAFLSLDSLEGDLAQGLLETVLGYVQTNLTCPGSDLDTLLAALQAADFETALDIFPTCTWGGGASFDEGLAQAFSDLLAQTGELLEDYHVCNNDAAVQKALFDGFAADGTIACPGGDLCRGPLWFYVAE